MDGTEKMMVKFEKDYAAVSEMLTMVGEPKGANRKASSSASMFVSCHMIILDFALFY